MECWSATARTCWARSRRGGVPWLRPVEVLSGRQPGREPGDRDDRQADVRPRARSHGARRDRCARVLRRPVHGRQALDAAGHLASRAGVRRHPFPACVVARAPVQRAALRADVGRPIRSQGPDPRRRRHGHRRRDLPRRPSGREELSPIPVADRRTPPFSEHWPPPAAPQRNGDASPARTSSRS